MTTAVMLQDQLAELRMMIDLDDPEHIEVEVAFAAMVEEIMHEAEFRPKSRSIRKNSAVRLTGPSSPHRLPDLPGPP
jgi:hypothetical protein